MVFELCFREIRLADIFKDRTAGIDCEIGRVRDRHEHGEKEPEDEKDSKLGAIHRDARNIVKENVENQAILRTSNHYSR